MVGNWNERDAVAKAVRRLLGLKFLGLRQRLRAKSGIRQKRSCCVRALVHGTAHPDVRSY